MIDVTLIKPQRFTRVLALYGHLSEWQFNWLSNKDALVNNDNTKWYVIFNKEGKEGLGGGRGGGGWREKLFPQSCNRRDGESKREKTRKCMLFYTNNPLGGWKWLALEREVTLTPVGLPIMQVTLCLHVFFWTFGSSRLPDLLCKHWFTSSLWSFCGWGADVPP